MLKKIIKKLKKRDLLLCQVDELEPGFIRGWVSYRNKEKFSKDIELYFNSKFITEISCNKFREDLLQANIGEGYGAFEFDYSNEIPEGDGVVELIYKKKKLFSSLVRERTDLIKNDDYGLVRFVNSLIKKNKIPEVISGIEVNILPSSTGEKRHYGDKFTRIINRTNKNRVIDIGDRLNSQIRVGDIICVACKSDSDTYLTSEFYSDDDKDDGQVHRVEVARNNVLTKYDITENISDKKKVKFKINIPPLSSLDLGSIIICEREQNLQFLNKEYSLEVESVVNTKKTISFSESNISAFKPQRKKQIISGLLYEEKNNVVNDIIFSLDERVATIITGDLNGYSRICSSIELNPSKLIPFKVIIKMGAGSDESFNGCYIYADGNNGRTLNKLHLKKRVFDDYIILDAGLSLKQTYDLSKVITDYDKVKIALEFKGHSKYEISEIQFGQFNEKPTNRSLGLGFEDQALEGQIDSVKAFNTVYKNEKQLSENHSIKRATLNSDQCIDIIIPVYNAKEFVIECIRSIQANTSIRHRIILMDDCSTDGISDYLLKLAEVTSNILHIRHNTNIGYTGNVNKGIAKTTSKWIVLINSDTIVSKFWLENMLETATLYPDVAIVGPLGNAASWQSIPSVFTEEGAWDFNLLPDGITVNEISRALAKLSHLPPVEVGVLNGFCQLINVSAFNEVGRLDEISFPQGYGEENDLCARLIKNNYKLLVCPTAYVYHHKSKSFGHESRAELSKMGNEKLQELHPDYNWKIVTQSFYNHHTMKYVRDFAKEIYIS